MNVEHLGQVFTRSDIVDDMLSLRANNGSILEPSCGEGAFSVKVPGCVSIEYDFAVCPEFAVNMDFFDYPVENKFDTIVGNPPYVKWKSILPETRAKISRNPLFDDRSNLSLFFIEKCVNHLVDGGELIFITPRDFLKSTSSLKLNEWLLSQGSFTHMVDLGDARIWDDGSCPNVIYWRFQKGLFTSDIKFNGENRRTILMNGQIIFAVGHYNIPFSNHFFVKVGAVSGADPCYEHEDGAPMVCSKTAKDGTLRKMIYNIHHPHLDQFKDRLITRGIKSFNEDNWWEWGRKHHATKLGRIYVNGKTREREPFYRNSCEFYDGSILAIFPKNESIDLDLACSLFNQVDWSDLGFESGGRLMFSQKSLENILLPESFLKI